jgi:hypothetical protein
MIAGRNAVNRFQKCVELWEPPEEKDEPPFRAKEKGASVYFLKSLNLIKIGFSKSVERRIREHMCSNHFLK